jgi:ubiquinone/menaquinone biosynthesis C-methylase UbiE
MSLLQRVFLTGKHVCPWWLAYGFDNAIRRMIHRPEHLMGAYVRPGMTVLDIGCGMGHFSIGMARMVGDKGKVIAVDLQPQMLKRVSDRARRQGLSGRIELHRCEANALHLSVSVDFILTFWMAHEVDRLPTFMQELHALLNDGGHYFLAEPLLHVSAKRFRDICDAAAKAGFAAGRAPAVRFSRAVVFGKNAEAASGSSFPEGRSS